jgi:hypothetical protein
MVVLILGAGASLFWDEQRIYPHFASSSQQRSKKVEKIKNNKNR